jgi:hypothetical protein
MSEPNDLDKPIWGAAAIGAEANLTPRQAVYALERGYLPGTKIGEKWMSTKRRLRQRMEINAA